MQTRLVNFYWTADAYDAPGTPAFQIAVEDVADSLEEAQALGGLKRRREALNMAQAAEIGLDLAAIGAAINTDLAERNAKLAAALAAPGTSPGGGAPS